MDGLNARSDIFRSDPVNIIRIFHIADAKSVDIHPDALRTITRSLDLITDDVRRDPEANRLFLEILSSRNNPERALRLMNEAGVFGSFVPEFGRVVGLMQFNMYHHYTVDEHLIRAVGNVAAIERGERKDEHPLSTDIIKRIKSREALYCAMLLHDIAKGLPGDHSDVGAAIANSLCPRLGLPADDTAVGRLAGEEPSGHERHGPAPRHFRSQDGAGFRRHVQSPEMLRLLLVLTVADIRAVGPGVWNGWKGQLLRELYYEAETVMTGGDTVPARNCARRRSQGRARPSASPICRRSARESALSRHYDSYWLAFEMPTHERHARLMTEADAEGELFVAGGGKQRFPRRHRDRALYARPSRLVLAIRRRHRHRRADPSSTPRPSPPRTVSRSMFLGAGRRRRAFGDAARVERLRQTIEKTLRGEIWPRRADRQATRRRRALSAFKITPRVNFDNEASATPPWWKWTAWTGRACSMT